MVPSRRPAIASGAPTSAIDMVRDLNRTGTFDAAPGQDPQARGMFPQTLLNAFLTSRNKDLVPANQAAILAR
jgi:hypothetical protein